MHVDSSARFRRPLIVFAPSRISGMAKVAFHEAAAFRELGLEPMVMMPELGAAEVFRTFGPLIAGSEVCLYPSTFSRASQIAEDLFGGYTNLTAKTGRSKLKIDVVSPLLYGGALPSKVRRFRPDFLICHTTLAPLLVWLPYLNRSTPTILYLHAETIKQLIPLLSTKKTGSSIRLIGLWERAVASRGSALVCNSHMLRRDVSPVLGRAPDVVFLGCDPIRSPGKGRNTSTVLSLTRWDVDRDPSFLLSVLARTKTRPIQLVIAGHWPSERLYLTFCEQVKSSGLENIVTIERDPSESRLNELYANSSAFVFPVRTYVGLGILEAATYGIPMITTTESGIWEMFTQGVHGFAAPEGDADAYATAIDNILRPEVASKMSRAVQTRVTELSWKLHAQTLLETISNSAGY